ncbi:CD99 molecule isoform X4 [Clupea harengus]|uniref:CD99 molecule isoform X4 n=1 Tax=Clupea harengus TaxID=7950 RepID=A0A8M1KA25_CLUHA|nr:CD99 molecule isoform X4 [Clupea harengus]
MTSFVWIVVLASLVATKAQDFDLTDALGDLDMVTEKPPLPKEPDAPKSPGGFDLSDALGPEPAAPAGGEGDLDLNDAFGGADDTPTEPKKPAGGNPDPTEPKKPTGGDLDLNDAFGGPGGFDLSDALGPDPEPEKPAVIPPKDGGTGGTGGGTFDDSDLFDVGGGGSDYKPDKGKGGARPSDPGHNEPAADQPADVALPWARVLQQLLGDDLPEGLGVWVANLKAVVQPLLQRALELIDVAMGNQEE